MLNHSFAHIPSVGRTTERKIWNSGIRTMDDFLESPPEYFSLNKQKKIVDNIHLSKERIRSKDTRYFYDNLPSKEHWRIFKEYRDATAYIDIETTGLGDPGDIITTIALYDGKNVKYYINGKNLDDFKKDIQQYAVLVTYNGKTFDIPFIERYFGMHISHSQIDLRYILKSLGYSGGLKSCERQLGIGRTGSLADVDGFFAVLLWNDYKRKGNKKSLETLLSYNIEDVLNLEYLMIEAYNRKLSEVPFELESLSIPSTPENPFDIDPTTVNRIKTLIVSDFGEPIHT
ncbi:MAG: ribonuclease H-like domain-containing protein [SAR324 cluster bacterium]|nr:ribonuclease H-like domain-containing protein [SAR324 cluster bacterium]